MQQQVTSRRAVPPRRKSLQGKHLRRFKLWQKKPVEGWVQRENNEQQSFILTDLLHLYRHKKTGGVYLGGRHPCSVGQAEARFEREAATLQERQRYPKPCGSCSRSVRTITSPFGSRYCVTSYSSDTRLQHCMLPSKYLEHQQGHYLCQ